MKPENNYFLLYNYGKKNTIFLWEAVVNPKQVR